MSTLVLAESADGKLLEATKKLLSAALAFDKPVHVLVVDDDEHKIVDDAAALQGVDQVHVATFANPDLIGFETIAVLASRLCADDHDVIIAADSGRGKHVLPLLAARLQIVPITGVSAVLDRQNVERPVYAGSLIEQVKIETKKTLLTIRTANFDPVGDQPPCPVSKISFAVRASHMEIIEQKTLESERPELANARIVVAGGRGLGSKENFTRLESLADALGAALGASRIAVDMGWAPHILQVGQTGVQISPDLYIALGISGAVQHIAGIKDAGVIVAINKNPDAPIFKSADYGIVGDLHELLPKLQATLVDKS